MLRNLRIWLKSLWLGFFVGMKNTEDATLHQSGVGLDSGTGVNQNIQERNVAKALLRGEVTQEVKELRHMTYAVDRESKKYTYYSPTLAIKQSEHDDSKLSYDRSDGLELITIQSNKLIPLNVTDSIKDVSFDNGKKENDSETSYEIGRLKHNHKHTITVEREFGFKPRYLIEDYTKMLTVKRNGENAVVSFYVDKYPNPSDFKSKGFVREVEKMMNDGLRYDIVDLKEVYFLTRNAVNFDDMIMFDFNNLSLRDIKEFDGHYVLSFNASFIKDGEDMTEQFYDPIMDKKYKNKESKNATVELDLSAVNKTQSYVCDECGKKVFYNIDEIDALPMTDGRDINDDNKVSSSTTEAMDVEIADQTFGKKLCKDCLNKHIVELYGKKIQELENQEK